MEGCVVQELRMAPQLESLQSVKELVAPDFRAGFQKIIVDNARVSIRDLRSSSLVLGNQATALATSEQPTSFPIS
jgi:hypothetical protein